MNLSLTQAQKQMLFVAFVTFALAVAAVFGYDYKVTQPRETARLTPFEKLLQPQIGVKSITRNGIVCDSGETNCVESQNGMNFVVYSDAGTTQKFKVTGSS